MELNKYQKAAFSTAIYPDAGETLNLIYPILGLAGETGEICNKAKKIQRDYNCVLTSEMREELIHELGDVLWYVAAVATELGMDLDSVAKMNLEKLSSRALRKTISGSGDKR